MSGCACKNVAMGSYDNQEMVAFPFATERFPVAGTKGVGIDRCILPEIRALWADGIETIASCCGHGVTTGSIIVAPEFEEAMLAKGYAPAPNIAAPAAFLWPIGV